MRKKLPITEEDRTKIIRLHLEKKTILQISCEVGFATSTIQRHISDFHKSFLGEGYFDVDEVECWLAPVSNEYK
jgi:hypothetical protein